MDITPLGVQYEDVQDKGAPPSSAGLAPDVTVTESSPMATEDRVLGRDSPDAVRHTVVLWIHCIPFLSYNFIVVERITPVHCV